MPPPVRRLPEVPHGCARRSLAPPYALQKHAACSVPRRKLMAREDLGKLGYQKNSGATGGAQQPGQQQQQQQPQQQDHNTARARTGFVAGLPRPKEADGGRPDTRKK